MNESTLRQRWLAAAALSIAAIALWLPAIATPWWGDDYGGLQAAREARVTQASWLAPFWPDEPERGFWRPLSQETYWRFVEGPLRADVRWAHASNLLLLLASCAGMAIFAGRLARVMDWGSPRLHGALAGAVYGALALHFLPVHWVATANSSIAVLWSVLALTCWMVAPTLTGARRWWLGAAIVLLQAVSLLSKETGVLLPLLMVCVSAFAWPRSRPGRPEFAALAGCIALIVFWLVLRSRFTLPAAPEYRMVLGGNVLRNAAALVAWLLNVPREALRKIATGEARYGVLWAVAAAVPMAVFLGLAGRPLATRTGRRPWLAAAAFVAIAYAPYFLLAWNAYEYYAATAELLPVAWLAHGLVVTRHVSLACLALALSSLVAVQGSRTADYPALIARARWAEQQLAALQTQPIELPLAVRVTDRHRFWAIGRAGLAWRLGVPLGEVVLARRCPAGAQRWLVQQADGDFRWEACGPRRRTHTRRGFVRAHVPCMTYGCGTAPSGTKREGPT